MQKNADLCCFALFYNMNIDLRNSDAAKWLASDAKFDSLFPPAIRQTGAQHWTPLQVVQTAAGFLAPGPGLRVLDIGSGVGKFCLAAAHFHPACYFTGVEQRAGFVTMANEARTALGIQNASFIHSNFTSIDFNAYDHFYFYNAFYENIADHGVIDDGIAKSNTLYHDYHRQLFRKLEKMPAGTRVAAFYSLEEDEMPRGYHIVNDAAAGTLKCWMRV